MRVVEADCLDALGDVATDSVNLIVTDPPYFRVKNLPWDRAWDSADGFLVWLGKVADEWARVLAPNGSLYCFASPQMSSRVESMLAERFTVLNHIVWAKPKFSTKAEMFDKETCRRFFPVTERIVFCEPFDADGSALRGSGYASKCQELHAGVFEPLRQYLVTERDRAGITNRQVDEWLGTAGMAGHYFGASQWALPTEAVYARLRDLFNSGPDYEYLRRDYEDLRRDYEYLRRDYEDLRRDYEDLRRPFTVTAEVPYTDVWTYRTVPAGNGKHPCEKPLPMMLDVVRASSRPGDLVLDCFAGSGVVGEAAHTLGRDFLGIEADPEWAARCRSRMEGRLELEGAA